jgi:hypothetical protein
MHHGHADILGEMDRRARAAGADGPPASLAGRALSAGLARLLLWQQRAHDRRQLQCLSDHAARHRSDPRQLFCGSCQAVLAALTGVEARPALPPDQYRIGRR